MPETALTIGIVGGKGRMGRWFDRFLSDTAGLSVLVSDIDTELSPEDLAGRCDVVILSVPMDVFPEVVKQVGPLMPEGAFLTDLCSLKERQLNCMLEYTKCEVVGTHPLFGPVEDSIDGRRVAICPGRGTKWLSWWQGLLDRYGAKTFTISSSEHDRTMAWVQALNHFILISLGKALEEDGIDLDQLLSLATPSFEQQLKIVSRLRLQDPELYATIQMANPYTRQSIDIFTRYANSLLDIISSGDRKRFVELFKEVQNLGELL